MNETAERANNPVRAACDRSPVSIISALKYLSAMFHKIPRFPAVGALAPAVAKVPAFVGEKGQGKSTAFKTFCEDHNIRYLPVNVAALDAETALTIPTLKLAGMSSVIEALDTTNRSAEELKTDYKNDLRYGTTVPWVDMLFDDEPTLVVLEEVLNIDYRMAEVIRALISNRAIDGDRISDHVVFCATANPPGTYSAAREQCSALLDRFYWIYVEANYDEWMQFMWSRGGGLFRSADVVSDSVSHKINFFQGFTAFTGALWSTADSPRTYTSTIDASIRLWEQEAPESLRPPPMVLQFFNDQLGDQLGAALFKYCDHGDDPYWTVITTRDLFYADDEAFKELIQRMESWHKDRAMDLLAATGYDLTRAAQDDSTKWVKEHNQYRVCRAMEYLPEEISLNILAATGQVKADYQRMAQLLDSIDMCPNLKGMLTKFNEAARG